MVESGFAVTEIEDVPISWLADSEGVDKAFDDLGVRNLDDDEALGTESLAAKVWELPPGAQMGAHGHETQEEFYLVLEGTFAVDIGPPGAPETHEVGPGGLFAASPEIAREYCNIGDELGRVLVVAAPKVADAGIPVAELGG